MRCLVFLGFVITAASCGGGSGASGGAAAGDAPVQVPAGYNRVVGPQGQGEMLTTTTRESALPAIANTVTALAGHFDASPVVVYVIASKDGEMAQATFTAVLANQPLRGMIVAQRGATDTAVTVVADTSDRFATTYGALLQASVPSTPAVPETPLERRPLPDGSGAISVPAGWNITAQNAMTSGTGPEGAFDLGINVQVYEPAFAATMMFRPPVVAPYGDAATEFAEIAALTMGVPIRTIQILERAPVAWNGVAGMLHFKTPSASGRLEGVAMVLSQPVGVGTWMYYSSSVSSPEATFAQNLPVLMRIWASWKTDDRVYQDRLNKAAGSLAAVSRIIRDTASYRRESMDRSAKAWDHVIRGTWTYEDTSTGKRVDASNDVSAVLTDLNRAEGFDRFRAVPFSELNKR